MKLIAIIVISLAIVGAFGQDNRYPRVDYNMNATATQQVFMSINAYPRDLWYLPSDGFAVIIPIFTLVSK